MRYRLLAVDPAGYRSHALHTGEVDWAETNCATDMWIEILHTWRLDPVAGLAFTVGTDFDGEQWVMYTYPEEDLRILYGIEVHELNVWKPLVEHLEDHLRLGHLVAVDVDAFHLPDTEGVTYGIAHQKTTIAVQMLDRDARSMGYFHNAGYAELGGFDFDGILHLGSHADPMAVAMPPFAATIRLDGIRLDPPDLPALVRQRLAAHLARRPVDNPVSRLAKRMTDDLSDIASAGMDAFHRYAFGSCRHLGANGELAEAFCTWLAHHDPGADRSALGEAARHYRSISEGAKAAEFTLARAARGRAVDLQAVMAPLESAWDQAVAILDARYGT
jgi:Domain of unknown function (DUF1839)